MATTGSAVKISSHTRGTRHRAKISSRICVASELGLGVCGERFAMVKAGKCFCNEARMDRVGEADVTLG